MPCQCCGIWRSKIDDPVPRCARPPPPRPGEADIIIVRHHRSPRPPELHRRPDPESLKWNRRRRPAAAAPPSRLERVGLVAELDVAARPASQAQNALTPSKTIEPGPITFQTGAAAILPDRTVRVSVGSAPRPEPYSRCRSSALAGLTGTDRFTGVTRLRSRWWRSRPRRSRKLSVQEAS